MTMTAAYTMTEMVGSGAYSISEAALYARVSPEKMARWLLGTSHSRPAVKSALELERNPEHWVTFYDLIQCLAIRDIRNRRKIPLDVIRQTIDTAEQMYGIKYPFARKHVTKLFGDQISLNIDGYGLVEASGGHRNQFQMMPVIERYLDDLSWDGDGLAEAYTPLRYDGFSVVIDRRIQFGEPVVRPGRYTARTLYDAYAAEGGMQEAAKAYGVQPGAIDIARRYFDMLSLAA